MSDRRTEDSQQMEEYCSELYSQQNCGGNAVLDCSRPAEEDPQPIRCEEVGIAVASLTQGKSVGFFNVPADLDLGNFKASLPELQKAHQSFEQSHAKCRLEQA